MLLLLLVLVQVLVLVLVLVLVMVLCRFLLLLLMTAANNAMHYGVIQCQADKVLFCDLKKVKYMNNCHPKKHVG